MELQIRQAESSDIESIQEMNAKLCKMENKTHGRTFDPDWSLTEEAANWFRERINDEKGFAMIVEDEQTVIGYIVGIARSAEEFRNTDTLAEIETMYLQSEYRGQGFGTKLMQEFKEWASEKGSNRLKVEASAQNKGAIRFYRENGFEDYSVTLEEDF